MLPQGISWVDHCTSFILGHFVLLTFSYLNKVFFYYILESIISFSPIFFFCETVIVGMWVSFCFHVYHLICNHYLEFIFSISFCAVISSIHTICLFSSIFPCTFTFLLKAHLSLSLVFLGWHCSGKLLGHLLSVMIRFWLSIPHPSPAFSLGVFLG